VTAREVSQILLLAKPQAFPGHPARCRDGHVRRSVPVRGGLVLSFERMNRILEIDERNRMAVVEPASSPAISSGRSRRGGCSTSRPGKPAVLHPGGNIAECAGGLRAVKYGVTRDYVLGLEVVLPTGEIIETGSRTLKSVAATISPGSSSGPRGRWGW